MGWSGPMTHRQYLAWQAWLKMQWNRPSRDNFYQMQTSAEVHYVLREAKDGVSIDKFKIKWPDNVETKKVETIQEEDPIQKMNKSKAIVGACLGIRIPKTKEIEKG